MIKFLSVSAAVVLSFLAAVGAAQAQERARPPLDSFDGPDLDGLYAKFSVGAIFPDDLEQNLVYDPNVVFAPPPPGARITRLNPGITVGGAVGYAFPSGFRTELEYRYARPENDVITEPPAGPVSAVGAVDAHFIMQNVYYDFFRRAAFTPYVGAGVGGAIVDNALGETDGAFAYQAKAGVETHLGGPFMFGIEYTYARTGDLVFGPDDFEESDAVVRAEGAPFAGSTVMATIRRGF